ncbi:MAG: hypothetical protein Q9209_002802 [Squamulea sp. 1 TL-2023]
MVNRKFKSQLVERRIGTLGTAKAFVVVPDQIWDGNDGSWSTFIIQVGTPPQYFRVIPSINGRETWIPLPIECQRGSSWCGNARGVEPFRNSSTAVALSTLDAGFTCSLNKSPMCENCVSVAGHCTTGSCAGQYCCGGEPGACNSAGCNGVSGICTAAYIGCPCTGDDFDILTNKLHSPGAANPATATGFQFNQSSTWSGIGNHTLQGTVQLSKTAIGLFGTDIVASGPNPGAALASTTGSTVAGIAAQPYYLGLLGLRPSNGSRFDNSSPSFLTNLKNQKLIPSLSFGYTAGAAYSEHTWNTVLVKLITHCITGGQDVLGSLTLGGYDRSKFTENTVKFGIQRDRSYALNTNLQAISASDTLVGDVILMSNNIIATIDSDLPFMYLPNAACKNFERAFGLSWDTSKELYLVNDTNHGILRTSNPSILFSFGQVNITLSYQAFDLQVTQPIAQNGTNYFPLRCSSDPSQYVLGRTFLQETYLLVDYEMSNFALSQALFNNQSDIVSIDHAVANPASEPDSGSSSSSSLDRGAIAGIAVGASVTLVLLLSLLFYLSPSVQFRLEVPKILHPTVPSSDDQNTDHSMTAIANESPFQRLEERLERLERANTTTELPEDTTKELPEHSLLQSASPRENASFPWQSTTSGRTTEGPRQELVGSPTARELHETRVIKQDQLKPTGHVFELGTDDSRRTSGK